MSVAIECRDHRRKADSMWLEQLHGKFESLPVDRLVTVSRSGFSANATARAKLWNIETITLESAAKIDWAASVKNLESFEIVGQHFTIERFTIGLEIPTTHDDDLKSEVGAVLHLSDGRTTSILPFLTRLVKRRECADVFMRAGAKTDAETLTMSIELPRDCAVFVDNLARRLSLIHIDMEVRCDFLRHKGFLQHGKYGNVVVAFGSGAIHGVPYNLAISERRGDGVNAALAFGGNKVDVHFDVARSPSEQIPASDTPPLVELSLAIPVADL